MIIQGQLLCNLCGCSMGVLHVLPVATFHVCPDCQLPEPQLAEANCPRVFPQEKAGGRGQ